MSLWQMSISGGIIIFTVIIIRKLAINRLPKKTFLFLWGIVLCRLLVPFNFSSPFSAYNFIWQEGKATPMQIEAEVTLMQTIGQPTTGIATSNFVENPINIPLLIWILGVIGLGAYFVITYFLCRREFQTSLPIQNQCITNWLAQKKIKRPISIRQSSRISTPLTYGIWQPIILMPKSTNWQDRKQLEYVLAHELVHIKRFDTVTKLLLTGTLCIHWFNPLVWAMYILANRDMELSCDEAVIHSFGVDTKSAYALTLISMEESKSRLTPLCNNFSKNAIEERITAIMKMKKSSAVAVVVATFLIIGVTTVFATSANEEGDSVLQAYTTDTMITQQEQDQFNREQAAELTKQFSVYKEYGLVYQADTDSLYYKGKLVRWFSDKINADNQYITFVRDNEGIDLQATRNSSYKLTGIAEVSEEEYLKNTQAIENAKSANGAYEQGDAKNNLNEQIKLLNQYGDFGISFNTNGEMLYNGELVRYFCDGVELEPGAWSTAYEYFNEKGTTDVFTKRTVIDLGNGGKDHFGNLIGLKKSNQAEFEQRKLSDFFALLDQTTISNNDTLEGTSGMTFSERFAKYKDFGIEYKEELAGSGYGNVYFKGELVKIFIDQTQGGGVFSYASKDGGKITVQTVYDSTGNLTGIKQK